jgi:hypothetical protein
MAHGDANRAHCHALMFFSGEDFDPDSVSNLLSLQPSHARRRGEPMTHPRPDRPTPLARQGVLSYSTYKKVISNDINDHLRYLLNAILPISGQLKALVDRDHLSREIVLFVDNPPADWRALIEKPVADTLDALGIKVILDDPSTITVVEET